MSGSKRSRRRGCLVWVVGLAVVGVVAAVVGGLWMAEGFREADRTGRALDERFADSGPFVPPLDGAVPPDRMERFLAVKADLIPFCETFVRFTASLNASDRPGDRGEVSVARQAFEHGRAAFRGAGNVRRFGRLVRTRNEALVREGIDLDEFAYIYVVTYYAFLGLEPVFRKGGDSPGRLDVAQRTRILEVLGRQLERMKAGLPQGANPEGVAALEQEIADLSEEPLRIPFQDGLPTAVAESIQPFAEPLVRSWCEATDPLELRIIERAGLGFRIY